MATPRIRFTLADLNLYVAWAGLIVAWLVFVVKTEVGLSPQPGELTPLFILVVAFVAATTLPHGQTGGTVFRIRRGSCRARPTARNSAQN